VTHATYDMTAAFRAELQKAKRYLRDALALANQIDRPGDDEDILDLLRELRGLTVLCRECYRTGRGVDEWACELWLYEHGYKRPASGEEP
jgi:hypothetical protein